MVANKQDVLNHYDMASHHAYPNDQADLSNQTGTHMDSHSVSLPDVQQIIDLSNELAKVSKENADMRKAMVDKEREAAKALTVTEYNFHKKEMQLQLDHNNRENSLKNALLRSGLFSRFAIYLELALIVLLILYIIR